MYNNGVVTRSWFALNNMLSLGWNAGQGVFTSVRLLHESCRVPVRVLFGKAMELSCSTNTSVSPTGKNIATMHCT